MAIRSIEIVCIPCQKCDRVKRMITDIIHMLEMENKTKIIYSFTHTPHLRDVSKYGVNPSQAPIVLINGQVEISGIVEQKIIKGKLTALYKS